MEVNCTDIEFGDEGPALYTVATFDDDEIRLVNRSGTATLHVNYDNSGWFQVPPQTSKDLEVTATEQSAEMGDSSGKARITVNLTKKGGGLSLAAAELQTWVVFEDPRNNDALISTTGDVVRVCNASGTEAIFCTVGTVRTRVDPATSHPITLGSSAVAVRVSGGPNGETTLATFLLEKRS